MLLLRSAFPLMVLLFVSPCSGLLAQNKSPDKAKPKPKAKVAQVGPAINQNIATPVSLIKAMKGFKVELLYSVPGEDQGSWVNLCVDSRGRILASDQFGGLYRLTPSAPGQPLVPSQVEKLPVEIRAINGMVWAHDALYVGVNDYEKKIPSGLYRISDSDADDQLDKVELLRELDARGDHGVHAVVPSKDGQYFYLICGNGTKPTDSLPTSPVPAVWGEDHLLPRMPDGRGFMRDVVGPGGIVYRVSWDGKSFEMYANGFRNIFDASLNHAGELFTYDADMEYDFNTPWYRPTRVNHVVSGGEFGWRNGAGKRPEFYPDNLPATVNIGPGSPTGTTFGYGAKFPAKYQNALYVLDWSWGKMYAIHLKSQGSTYVGEKEEFLIGSPLPLTDAIIHPQDGAMYFAIGGRRVQSGLYRVTYVGEESTDLAPADDAEPTAFTTRHQLECFHGKQDPQAVSTAWPFLDHQDRWLRWAARVAIEHQPLDTWLARTLEEKDSGKQVAALMAAARVGGVCPQIRQEDAPPVNAKLGEQLVSALLAIDWNSLNQEERLTYVRTIEIVFNRFGPPLESVQKQFIELLEPHFPAKSFELNWLLCETLVYLQSPMVAAKAMALIQEAPTQEEQLEYARSLRMLRTGWELETRKAYFEWLLKAANYRGGASFEKFVEFIRTDALATLAEEEKVALKELLERKPETKNPIEVAGAMFAGRTPHAWTLEELVTASTGNMTGRDFSRGRKLFGAAACFNCHRFNNEGGMTGPDLSSAGRRYSVKDLIDQIVNPSKVINEQFVPIEVVTEEGEKFRGVVVNLSGDKITLNTDAADPNQRKEIDRKEVISIEPSKLSPMPTGLMDMMTEDEILDLLAYVTSGGDSKHPVFQ
jgi:putative heme-binding domain-containing protein